MGKKKLLIYLDGLRQLQDSRKSSEQPDGRQTSQANQLRHGADGLSRRRGLIRVSEEDLPKK